MFNFKIACYALWSALVVVSCAPSTASKTDLASGQAGGAGAAAKGPSSAKGEGERSATRESATDRSSLSQLQEGKSASEGAGPLKDIYFDFDSHNLNAEARETLRGNATWLKSNPAARAEIEGHSDERGTNEYNLALGAKRAQTAKDFLATLGVGAERLSTISYGEEIPMCKDSSESCWQRNRRARFVVLPSRPAS